MVRVCDAIMGSGKSSAAINFMNEHPEKRFIYVTPYKGEAWRVATACHDAEFYYPEKDNEHKWSKVVYTMDMVNQGKSVATTHQAFKYYPPEMIDLIAEQHYTLIIDESLEGLGKLEDHPSDIQMAIDAGYLGLASEDDPDTFVLKKDVYRGKTHRDLFRVAKTREVIRFDDGKKSESYIWQIPEALLLAFDDVYVLTYMFKGQGFCNYLEVCGISYENIGVSRYDDGSYHFNFTGENYYVPEYVKDLPDLIKVVDGKRINSIGDKKNSLSKSWYENARNKKHVIQMKKNLNNFFTHIAKVPKEDRAWSVYMGSEEQVADDGYRNAFLPFNERATNKHRNRTALAYCLNVFMNVNIKNYFLDHNVKPDEDLYALSNMIQWIWRSAIRDGKPVTVYVPSKRMRTLLTDWIKEVSSSANV